MDKVIFSSLTSLMSAKSDRDRENNKIKIEKAYKQSLYDIKLAFKTNEKDILGISDLILNIKSSIANGLKQVQLLRSELGSCKRLLFLKKKGVSNSWMKKLESETLCDMVENVKSVIQMSDTIVSLTQQYDFLAASEKVKEIDTQLSNDPRLMTIVGDFRKKFDEKIAILTKEIKNSLEGLVFGETLEWINQNMSIPKRSVVSFDYRAENSNFSFSQHSIDPDTTNLINEKIISIISALNNLNALDEVLECFFRDVEVNLKLNIFKLILNEFKKFKKEVTLYHSTQSEEFTQITTYFVYRSILVFCANVGQIIESLYSCAQSSVSSRPSSGELFDKISVYTLYDQIQSVLAHFCAQLNGVSIETILSLSEGYTENDKEQEMHQGGGQAGQSADADEDLQAIKELNAIMLEMSVSKNKVNTDFKFKIPQSDGSDNQPTISNNNVLDINALGDKLEISQIVDLPPFSTAKDYQYVKLTYDLTSKFVHLIEENLGSKYLYESKMILKLYLSYFISKIYLDKYVKNMVTQSLDQIMSKFDDFEVISVSDDPLKKPPTSAAKPQLLGPGSSKSADYKTVLLSFNQVILLGAKLLENIVFLESDWNHSNKIFEHFSNLLSMFYSKTSESMNKLISIYDVSKSTGSLNSQQDGQAARFGISANLVTDDRRFKAFYSSFSTLVNKNLDIRSAIDTFPWFEAEYHLINRLRSFSIKHLIDPRYYPKIAMLAESLFWFARNFARNSKIYASQVQMSISKHCLDLLGLSARLMLTLRLEIKLRLLLHYDSSKRAEKNYKESIFSILKLVSKVCADLPPEVKKIVTWGMGSYIRMLFLNKIADAKEYPTLSIAQSFSLAEEVLMIRLILHDIEENFVNEMDKLLFFCEFLSVVTTSPESIVQHAKEAKKFNYYEYSVLLEVSYRNIDHSEENKKFRQEHEDVLRVIFNKPPVNEPKSAEK